ncbi:potassium channel family protein [Streptosporangium sp. NPDC006007]|uniref:potassium channel family protein n=1 Tax=Streptosporangium sp. NPDC006007 TaxID=3154575 RepID=UPI00339FBD78
MSVTGRHRVEGEAPAAGEPPRRGGVPTRPSHSGSVPSRLRRWEGASEIPLILASLAFLAAFAALVLAPGLPHPWAAVCRTVLLGTWTLFAADVVVRLALTPDRRAFLRGNWLALVILAVPTLCPLRAVSMISRASIRRRRGRLEFQAQVAAYAGLTALLFGLTSALAVLHVERGAPGATIHSFGDAAWWAISTIATVGYGDVYPVTARGRWVGGVLMLGGLGLLGVVTASFASWFTTRFHDLGHLGDPRKEDEARSAEPLRPPRDAPEGPRGPRRPAEGPEPDDTGHGRRRADGPDR